MMTLCVGSGAAHSARCGPVGSNMGVARLSMFSDGTFYMPLNSFRQHEDWLCKVQQSITCKVKFSN